MSVPSMGPYRPRTMVHPGPMATLRLEHVAASGQRQWRLTLAPGQVLLSAVTGALAAQGVRAASMALLGGDTLVLSGQAEPLARAEEKLVATLSEGIRQHRVVEIEYQKEGEDTLSTRLVEPHVILASVPYVLLR